MGRISKRLQSDQVFTDAYNKAKMAGMPEGLCRLTAELRRRRYAIMPEPAD